MDTPSLTKKAQVFFTLIGFSVLVFVWFSLLLGISGVFFLPIIACGFALIGTLACFLFLKMLSLLDVPERAFLIILIVIALLSILPSIDNPTVFTGRDQGSIATAAIALAEHHDFRFSLPIIHTFFSVYGPGAAYHFPGFFYTNHGQLLTQFPLTYASWIGSFFLLFELKGIAIGNSILLSLSLISFYFLLRLFLHRFLAFLGTLLFATSFLIVWFGKFTLTENLALFLFVFLSLTLTRFHIAGRFLDYASSLGAAMLLCFTRIEGFAILPIVLILLYRTPEARHIWKLYPKKSLLIPACLFLITGVATFPDALPFYVTIGKALQSFLTELAMPSVATASVNSPFFSLLILFFLYGLLGVMALGLIGIPFLLRQKKYLALIPVVLAIPTFAYFVFPNITPDHPWMLRRYLPTIYPALVFSCLISISLYCSPKRHFPLPLPTKWSRRLMLSLCFVSLFALQIPAWYRGLLTWENFGLLDQTKKLAENFGSRDLILIDRDATGSRFAMMPGPLTSLFHKNAVYFFNATDLEKIDRSPYEHTWLIIPSTQERQWTEALSSYTLKKIPDNPDTNQFGSMSLGSSTLERSQLHFPQVTPFGNAISIFEIE